MTIHTRASLAACAASAVVLATTAPRVEATANLATARELYASAAYGDALAILDDLLAANPPREERQSIDLYRTLCLVALGRRAEADKVVEAMISQDPLYRPSADDIPPRVRSAFSEARKRLLPSIILQKYAEAKSAYDRQEFAAAAVTFTQVLDGLADPDIANVAAQPPLSDLRTLADGFHALSTKAAAPPPPVVVEPPPAPAVPVKPRIYGAGDPGVVPPLVIRQEIPTVKGKVRSSGNGVVEVVIDETGAVETARMAVPLNSQYDQFVLSAARTWRYQPANVNSVPVKFRKLVKVSLLPTPD